MVDIPKFEELPYKVRKSPRHRWNYLCELLGDGSEDEESSEPETPLRNIHIDITDGTDGIEGATVVIGETSKTTGSAGGCNFTGLTDGEKSVTVTAEGYSEKTETITVSENDTTFTIALTAVEGPGES